MRLWPGAIVRFLDGKGISRLCLMPCSQAQLINLVLMPFGVR